MAEKVQVVLDGKDTSGTAFQSFQANIAKAQAAIAGFAGGIAGGVVAQLPQILSAAFEHVNPKSVIDAADQLNKLSQRTGIAVETLGALEYAGKLADVSTDELASSLKKLNVNIAAAARGEKEQAGAFAAIGVSVKDANGDIRDAGEVLGDIADKFSGYKDGANKVALANALGGKSFEKLIPLLNGGRQGFADAKAELEKLGAAIGPELARKAEVFNDNLTKLAVSGTAVKVTLASGLIDTLVDLSDKQLEAVKSGNLLANTFDHIKGVLFGGPGIIKDFVFGKALAPDKLKVAADDVARLTPIVERLQKQLAEGYSQDTADRLDRLGNRLKTARAALEAEEERGRKIGAGRGVVNPPNVTPPPVEAPGLRDSSAADAAEAVLRKRLEGDIRDIRARFENEKDVFTFGQKQLDELYQHGEVSIEDYYAAKAQAAADFLPKQQQALQDEIAAQRAYQAKTTKPQNAADAENKISEALVSQGKAYREAGQAAQDANQQKQRAFQDAGRMLLALDAEIAELGGDKLGADLARNALKVGDVATQLGKLNDPARLKALRDQLDTQAKVNASLDEFAKITDRVQVAEDAFLLSADHGGKSLLATEEMLKQIRAGAIPLYDAEIAKIEAITNKTADQELELAKLKVARDRAYDAQDPSLKRYRDALEEIGQVGASSLEDLIVNGGKVSDTFKALEKDLVRVLTHDFLTAPLATSLSNWLKDLASTGGAKSGGLGGSDLVGGIGGVLGRIFGGGSSSGGDIGAVGGFFDYGHNGGLAGSMGTSRRIDPQVFATAERYHSGGLVGLMHDEVPAILRKREEVLRTDDPRHRDNWSGATARAPVTQVLNFHLSSPPSRDTQSQIARRAGIAITQAMQRDN